MVLSIVTETDCEGFRLDVKAAFIYANIEENVFVENGIGFETMKKEES